MHHLRQLCSCRDGLLFGGMQEVKAKKPRKIKPTIMVCPTCGKEHTPDPGKRYKSPFCSYSCKCARMSKSNQAEIKRRQAQGKINKGFVK